MIKLILSLLRLDPNRLVGLFDTQISSFWYELFVLAVSFHFLAAVCKNGDWEPRERGRANGTEQPIRTVREIGWTDLRRLKNYCRPFTRDNPVILTLKNQE